LDKRQNLIIYPALIIAMLLWATSFPLLKLAFSYYDPMFVIWARLLASGIFFLVLWPKIRIKNYRKGDYKYLILMAIFEPCFYFVFEARALEYTSASQAGMISGMLPLMVAIAAFFFLKETITKFTITGFVLAVTGVCWLSLEGMQSDSVPDPVLGNFFEFIAMLCATGYTISVKRLVQRYSPLTLTAIQSFVGIIFFSPIVIFTSSVPANVEPVGIFAIVYLGVFVSAGAFTLYNYGISAIPANQASVFINLIPVFTIFFSWIILREKLTPLQYPACVTVLAGVFISQLRSPAEKL